MAGLVSRVLVQSGPWGLEPQDPDNAAEHANAYLRLLAVPDGADVGEALRAVPVERLLSAYGELAVQLARPGNVAPRMYPVLGGAGVPRGAASARGRRPGRQAAADRHHPDEMTAFLGFDPRIQSLTPEGARHILSVQRGAQGPEVYQRYADQLPHATPTQILTVVETGAFFRVGAPVIADHHAAGGNATYVYQWDYSAAGEKHTLGAAHCGELPFLFGTFDTYPDGPMLGSFGDAERTLGHTFATAVAEFVTTGSVSDWLPYASGTAARIRRFG
ncbi:carboxylesterase family protein [Streptomyces cylindrosporus]|uniref:Carboxylesterase family protein n=1 Tax=Streptomyces cylindrosporus TaxID=2927583 RepID=A0ABS9YI74_9ACTN|nr:carboxylesterase family protein [Streptomyces cylindrosporus]MCI3276951.1 carboxylesterase family protein [Streptomyces cylindrosporus]